MTREIAAEVGHDEDGEGGIERKAGRFAAIGGVVGFVLAFAGVVGASLLWGRELGSAIGLGLFIGFWGGLGFGVMIGGVTALAATMDHP